MDSRRQLFCAFCGSFVVALSVVWGAALWAEQVSLHDGNIYYVDDGGGVRQLTSAGMDSDPSISPDGRTVVFIRRTTTPAGFTEPTDPHPTRTQVCLLSVTGAANMKVVYDGAVAVGQHRYATFSEPHMAPDNRHVYFLIHLAVVEFGLVKLDLADGQVRMISEALDWHLITSGRYAGDLVVQKRKTHPDGINLSYWLLSEDGKELGYVGQSEREALAFLDNPERKIK